MYIGPKSRTERRRKTKIGTEVAHVTRNLDTTFKVKRSKVKVTRPLYSPPCWRIRQLQRWAWERVGREKLLLCCRLLGHEALRRPWGEERGSGISWRPPAYSLFYIVMGTERHPLLTDSVFRWMHSNSSITAKCIFISEFLLHPWRSPATFVYIPWDAFISIPTQLSSSNTVNVLFHKVKWLHWLVDVCMHACIHACIGMYVCMYVCTVFSENSNYQVRKQYSERSCLLSAVAGMYSCSQLACLALDWVYQLTSWMPQRWRWEQSVSQNFPPWNGWCSAREHSDQMQPSTAKIKSTTCQSRTETSSTVSLGPYRTCINTRHV